MYINEMTETGGYNTSRGIIYDAKGQGKVFVKAGLALVAGTAYEISYDEDGREAIAVATAGNKRMIGVAEVAVASGSYGWLIVEGEVELTTPSITTTAGHAVKMDTAGVIADSGAAYSSANDEFGVFTSTDASAGTTHSAYLVPREIIWAAT